MAETAFNGFTQETLLFFAQLAENNNQPWFKAHKTEYDRDVIAPAKALVTALGHRLAEFAPTVVADTRINGAGSIFRIYRDVRFSHDKRPYKTHLGILWWEGPGKKLENPGYYLHLENGRLMLGAGMYQFTKEAMALYRQAAADEKSGAALLKTVETLSAAGPYSLGGSHYKRVPRGYDKDHPMAKWLKYNGLWSSVEMDVPQAFYNDSFIDLCAGHFRNMQPLHAWLQRHVNTCPTE